MTEQWLMRLYFLVINLFLFAVMGVDKQRALTKDRRVPEATLFLLALLGGSFGGTVGMLVFNHKTRHYAFVFGYSLMMLAQVIIAMWLKIFIL